MLVLPILVTLLPSITLCYNPVSTTAVRYSDIHCSNAMLCPTWTYCDNGICQPCIECNWRTDQQKDIALCRHPVWCKSGRVGVENEAKTCSLLQVDKTDHFFECSPKCLDYGNPLGTSCVEHSASGTILKTHRCVWRNWPKQEAVWKIDEHNFTTTLPINVVSHIPISAAQTITSNPDDVYEKPNDSPTSLIMAIAIGTTLGIALTALLVGILLIMKRGMPWKRPDNPTVADDIARAHPSREGQEDSDISSIHLFTATSIPDSASSLDSVQYAESSLSSIVPPRRQGPQESMWPGGSDSSSLTSESFPNRRPVELSEPCLASEANETGDYFLTFSPHQYDLIANLPTRTPNFHTTSPSHQPYQYTQHLLQLTESDSGASLSRSHQSCDQFQARDQFLQEQETLLKKS